MPTIDGVVELHPVERSPHPHAQDRRLPIELSISTEELYRRPRRPPNFEYENRALIALTREVTSPSPELLEKLVEAALTLCRAQSGGVSLLEERDGEPVFVWRALAGEWAHLRGRTLMREFAQCAALIERNCALLLQQPECCYGMPAEFAPPATEALLIPFHVSGRPVGAIWAIAHDRARKFDLEDVRVLTSLSGIASAAYYLQAAHEEGRRAREELEAKTAELQRLTDTSLVGLTRLDRSLRYRSANRAYAEIVGAPVEDIVGRTMPEVMHARSFAVLKPYIERVLAGEAVEYEAELPCKRYVHVSYAPDFVDGEVVGWVASVKEITERKRMEIAAAKSARQKEALYELGDRLHHARSLAEICDAALDAIVGGLQCDRGSILLLDEAGVLRCVAQRGLSDGCCSLAEGRLPWAADASDPEPACIADVAVADLSEELRRSIEDEGIAGLAFIPLSVNGRLIGEFMACCNSPHAFTADEMDLAQAIARQLAFAIDRERAQEMLRRQAHELALITDTAPVLIAYLDAQMRFRFVNKSYARCFGVTPEECVGKRLDDIVGEQAQGVLRQHVDRVLAGQPVEFETDLACASSIGARWMHCSYAPQLNERGEVVAFVAALIDITERRRAEQALRGSEEKLREADRRKDEFLAMLAHELRNPLAPIANAVHLLHEAGADHRVQRHATAIIDRQTTRLTRLVDDLLEVSRITTGRIQLNMEPLAVAGVVERAVETVRTTIEQHRHRLILAIQSAPIWVYGDAARLEQVIVNLLNNSAKYTEDGGRIQVTARSEDGYAVIRVADTGIGIEPELLPRVFDLFTQAERSLDRSHGGLGIGLSLVKRLVAKHGGVVEAKSVVGRGSEFIVRLPLMRSNPSNASVRKTTSIAPAARPLQVLVVDDNDDSAHSLALLLENSGHHVQTAHDGATALELCREVQPDLVFLDIGLPDIDGYVVARRLRESFAGGIMLVALTGYGQAADRARSREAGFDHHLVKPADWLKLKRIIAEAARTIEAHSVA